MNRIRYVLITLLLFYIAAMTHQHAFCEQTHSVPLNLSNPKFRRAETGEQPIANWYFHERVPGAALSLPPKGDGAILLATSEAARGDLLASPRILKPFRVIEITLEYEVIFGKPVLLTCLRPLSTNRNVDLQFLPIGEPGKLSKATAVLHAGTEKGKYCVQFGILGKGAVKLISVKAYKKGLYKPPKRPLFVLDIVGDEPIEKGKLGVNYARLVAVFGFPSIEHRHYTELTLDYLKKLKPALVFITGISPDKTKNPDSRKIRSALGIVKSYSAPIVAVCGGHEYLAITYGMKIVKGKEWGPIAIKIKKDGPLFDGLSRKPFVYLQEYHYYCVDATKKCDRYEIIASTKEVPSQIFKYKGKPWYTFQPHIELFWETSCPAGCVLFKNMLKEFKIIS